MNGTRVCYTQALRRLAYYLEDSLDLSSCPDADACHAGLDAIRSLRKGIESGEKPWEDYDYGEDAQDPDGEERVVITLQRGHP